MRNSDQTMRGLEAAFSFFEGVPAARARVEAQVDLSHDFRRKSGTPRIPVTPALAALAPR